MKAFHLCALLIYVEAIEYAAGHHISYGVHAREVYKNFCFWF